MKNLDEMSELFQLTKNEFCKATEYAEIIGWKSAKPSTIALAIIRLVRPKLTNMQIYNLGHTEFATMRKWTLICSRILGIKQRYYR